MTTYYVEAGEFLKFLRLKSGLTQRDVAQRTGYTVNFISLIERGINKPNDELISKLADLYKIDEDEIFQKYGQLPPSVREELQTNHKLRKTLYEIVNDDSISEEDKQRLYDRIAYWYEQILKEREKDDDTPSN